MRIIVFPVSHHPFYMSLDMLQFAHIPLKIGPMTRRVASSESQGPVACLVPIIARVPGQPRVADDF